MTPNIKFQSNRFALKISVLIMIVISVSCQKDEQIIRYENTYKLKAYLDNNQTYCVNCMVAIDVKNPKIMKYFFGDEDYSTINNVPFFTYTNDSSTFINGNFNYEINDTFEIVCRLSKETEILPQCLISVQAPMVRCLYILKINKVNLR